MKLLAFLICFLPFCCQAQDGYMVGAGDQSANSYIRYNSATNTIEAFKPSEQTAESGALFLDTPTYQVPTVLYIQSSPSGVSSGNHQNPSQVLHRGDSFKVNVKPIFDKNDTYQLINLAVTAREDCGKDYDESFTFTSGDTRFNEDAIEVSFTVPHDAEPCIYKIEEESYEFRYNDNVDIRYQTGQSSADPIYIQVIR